MLFASPFIDCKSRYEQYSHDIHRLLLFFPHIIKIGKSNNEFSNELSKITAIWRYWIWKYRKNESFDSPIIFKVPMNRFHKADIPMFHPTFLETGFSIKFEENEVKLTSLEKYHRISLKIFEEDMKYLKEQSKDSKIIMMMELEKEKKAIN